MGTQVAGVEHGQEYKEEPGWRRLPEDGANPQPVTVPQGPSVRDGMGCKEHADQAAHQRGQLPGPNLVDRVDSEEQSQGADQTDERKQNSQEPGRTVQRNLNGQAPALFSLFGHKHKGGRDT